MNSEKYLTFEELIELVPRVPYQGIGFSSSEEETLTSKQRVNKTLLHKLRVMDYLSRDRLLTFMNALLANQLLTRERYKESLYRFVGLIDQVEKTIQADDFAERLLNASSQLPREKRKALLEYVEQQKKDEN